MKPITNYTDCELLKLTAVYCGKKTKAIVEDQNDQFIGLHVSGKRGVWNPLTDAGDRARMCDELHISVLHWLPHMGIVTAEDSYEDMQRDEYYANHNNSRTTAANYAAVRLVAMMQLAKQDRQT